MKRAKNNIILPAWCHYHQQLCSQTSEMDLWNPCVPGVGGGTLKMKNMIINKSAR